MGIRTSLTASLATCSLAVGLLLAAMPAQAGTVFCEGYGFSGSNGGHAWATKCRHTGVGENTRLRADCKLSPFYSYSPTLVGSFSNMNFNTGHCTFGVKNSLMQHNF